jgi:hypothetical protein
VLTPDRLLVLTVDERRSLVAPVPLRALHLGQIVVTSRSQVCCTS